MFLDRETSLPRHVSDVGVAATLAIITPPSELEALFLLICVPYRKFATRLPQPELSHISPDQEFFFLLRREYKDHFTGIRYAGDCERDIPHLLVGPLI